MTEPPRAVFLSYASQDAEVAQKICEALRTGGIEVFLDQSELRGGDAWDAKIREQINQCALFVPVISANAHARAEGYFRLEWKLAVDRSHRMAPDQAFLLPVVVDDTGQSDKRIPDRFRELQWTRLPAGKTPPEFVARVRRLLTPESPTSGEVPASPVAVTAGALPLKSRRASFVWPGIVAVLLAALSYLAIDKIWLSKHVPGPQNVTSPTAVPASAAGVAERSIAVLPFADMSERKDQEYFADGLAEELLDLLAKTPGLHVIARTSSFSFKGKSDDIPTIAAKLKVANILEGSVRKSGNRLRVTTQLVQADGEHLWSETYDREMKDIFAVQDEIATAVVAALKLKFSAARAAPSSRSTNTDAYLQYLLGQQSANHGEEGDRRSVAAYRQAIALDPKYAAAYAGLALAQYSLADETGNATGVEQAMATAERAVELASDQAMGYAARGYLRSSITWDWDGAQSDFARALELDPNDPIVLRRHSGLLQNLGRFPEAIAAARKATELDPFSAPAWWRLAEALYFSGDLPSAGAAARRALAIDPTGLYALNDLGTIELLDRRPAEARAAFQRIAGNDAESLALRLTGLAMAEHSLGHSQASQQALDEAIAKTAQGSAYEIAEAYAWRAENDKAFEWLERAYRQRDGGVGLLKTDPLLASIRSDRRYGPMLKKINLQE